MTQRGHRILQSRSFAHVRLGSLLSAATVVVAEAGEIRAGQADHSGELGPLFD
jgi:hypothetical protein